MDIRSLINDCLAKSSFLDKFPHGQLLDGFFSYMDASTVSEDMNDESVFNSGFYSGYSISADIKDMRNDPEGYFLPLGEDIQIPIEEGTCDKFEVFDAPNHSVGVRGTVFAEHIQNLFDDIHSKYTINDVSDITADVIKETAGNLFAVDIIPVPSKSFFGEKDLDTVVKMSREDILETLGVTVGDKVAVIGGDKSSASGRKRKYILDSYYYQDKKNYKSGVFARQDRVLPGDDYYYEDLDLMISDLSKRQYVAFTFNYCDDIESFGPLFAYFRSMGIPGYGLYIDPDYNDKDLCTVETYDDNVYNYNLDVNKMRKFGLQVKTLPDDGQVHFCTSHGYIYEKMLDDSEYIKGIKLSDYIYNCHKRGKSDFTRFVGYKSTMHYKVFFTSEVFDKMSCIYLESEVPVDEDAITSLLSVRVESGLVNINGENLPLWLPFPDGVQMLYRYDKDKNIKFVDIDIDTSFFTRVMIMERYGFKTIYKDIKERSQDLRDEVGFYLYPYNHKFCSEPWKLHESISKYVNLELLKRTPTKKDLAEGMSVYLKGIGYDPQFKCLVYSELGESFMILDREHKILNKNVYRVSFLQNNEDEEYSMVESKKGDFCVFGCNLVFYGKPVDKLEDSMFGEVRKHVSKVKKQNEKLDPGDLKFIKSKEEEVVKEIDELELFDKIINQFNNVGVGDHNLIDSLKVSDEIFNDEEEIVGLYNDSLGQLDDISRLFDG
jgi:hypothetical protein